MKNNSTRNLCGIYLKITILNVKEHYPVPIEISEYRLQKNGKIKLLMSVLFFNHLFFYRRHNI
jgi:hypothetical protein